MFILLPLIAALIASYIIWLFNNRIMGKKLGLTKLTTWIVVATFMIYFMFSALSFFVEGT